MPKGFEFKSVILCDNRKISEDFIQRLIDCPDGTLMRVDPGEMNAFVPLMLFMPEVKKLIAKPKPKPEPKPEGDPTL